MLHIIKADGIHALDETLVRVKGVTTLFGVFFFLFFVIPKFHLLMGEINQ